VKVVVWFTAGETGDDTSEFWAATLLTDSVLMAAVATVKFVSPL
jgi:hypothetical protein